MVTASRAAEAWNRAAEERAFWQDHQQQYMDEYAGEFVAVKDKEVVAHRADFDAILKDLDDKGLEPAQVWVRYFQPRPGSSFF